MTSFLGFPDPRTMTREEKIAEIDRLRVIAGLDPEPQREAMTNHNPDEEGEGR